MDALALEGVDLVHDLDTHPWPLPDAHFEHVRAKDILEHVDDFVGCVEELWRVLKPSGRLTVRMPFAGGVNHLTDPTHRRGAMSRTFDYFVPGRSLYEYGYSKARFELHDFRFDRGMALPLGALRPLWKAADSRVLRVAERFHDFYEQHLTGLYAVHNVEFELAKLP